MSEPVLLQLSQDLEWLGCELEYCGHRHAMEGFPEAGPTWDAFCEKRDGVLITADKIDRELKNAVRYNPAQLVGVDYPIAETLDSVTDLLTAVEMIKQSALFAVHELPARVRTFTKMVEGYLKTAGVMGG